MTKEILRQIMDEHPKATRDELGKLYTAALRDDPDAAESVLLTVYAEMSVLILNEPPRQSD
jgi:hypothetical protein